MELPFGTLIRDRHRTIRNFQSDRSSKDTSIACRVDVFDQVDRSSHSYDDCPAPKRNHWKVKRCVLVARVTERNLNGTKRKWIETQVFPAGRLTTESWMCGTDAPDRNRDQPRTDWVQKTLYESGASSCPPLVRPVGSPTRRYPRGSLAVPVQTVYSLLHAPSSSLKREQSNGGARVTRLDLCEW